MKYQRIRDLREDSDLTQTQIGEKLNIPQRTYAYYESGERTIPPEILIALADFYKISWLSWKMLDLRAYSQVCKLILLLIYYF